MKITLFIGGLSGGGAERVTCNLANYLVKKGHEVEILTVSNEPSTYKLHKNVTRWSMGVGLFNKNPLKNPIRICRFVWYVLTHKCDAYLVMLPRTTYLLLQVRWMVKAKIIAAQRIMPSSLRQNTQLRLKKVASKAEGWIFQTPEQFEWFNGLIGQSRIKIIPNAINPDFIMPFFEGKRKQYIVTSGRLTKQKNHKLLISAFFSIASDFPDYTLIIYGEGPLQKDLENQIKSLGLTHKVLLPGYITNINEKIFDASLFVLSSDFEGMPNALMEAMAMGVPSISTDCDGGGARFLIENGKNGLLVPKNDVDALAEAMRDLLSHPEKAERLGEEGRKLCERLAPEKIYGEWEEFIKDVVNC